jgi:hypothetical protein
MAVMDLTAYIIIAFCALIHGILGLGFPMLATPLLALGSDVRTAIVLLLWILTVIAIVLIAQYVGTIRI